MTRKILIATLMGAGSFAAFGQLSGSVSVEGEYLPLVIETERLNTFPRGYKFELPAANLDYELNGMVTDFRPGLLTMGVTGRQTSWPGPRHRGYVDFRLGSWLDSRLDAGYTIFSDSVNTLSANLKFNSAPLYRTHGVPDSFTEPVERALYNGKIGVDYSRVVGSEGLLNADVSYRLGYFNYYGTLYDRMSLPAGTTEVAIPTQTINQAHAGVGYSSSPSLIKGWHAGANVDYTGYRRGDRETWLDAAGGYAFNFADNSAVAIDATGNFLFYSASEGITKPSNYGMVSLKPAYRLVKDGLKLSAGVDMTVSYDAMGTEPGKKFGAFHAAPDVSIEYGSKAGIGVFLSARGGVTPATLAMREDFDLYQRPWLLSNIPVYTPVDARLGLNAGPFAGFSGGVALRYVVAKNLPVGGWYQAWLGTYLPRPFNLNENIYLDPYRQTVNLSGMSVDLHLKYDYGTIAGVEFNGSYTPQNATEGIFNGFDRPRWVMEVKAYGKPIDKLKIEAGYDYRGVRNCYAWVPGSEEPVMTAYRLPDITDLNAKITYSLLKNLDIYVKGENLLNRRIDLLPGLQAEGIVVQGGFFLTF